MRVDTVNLALNGARVTRDFREALFNACAREGVGPNEFVIKAAAEKLQGKGVAVAGVFAPGDMEPSGAARPGR